jgi:hypothetical protein
MVLKYYSILRRNEMVLNDGNVRRPPYKKAVLLDIVDARYFASIGSKVYLLLSVGSMSIKHLKLFSLVIYGWKQF